MTATRYFYRAQALQAGFAPIVAAPQSELRWLALGQLWLDSQAASYSTHSQSDEIGLDILGGACSILLRGEWGQARYEPVGKRPDPFSGPPSMVYVPRQTEVTIACLEPPVSAILVRAPSGRDLPPCLIGPETVPGEDFGRDNWQRRVYASLGPNVNADRLVMGETHTPSGNWSSYPPHKHDVDVPPETVSEEIYHFRIDPPHGFGLQYLWTAPDHPQPPIQEAFPLQDRDTVAIPRGYHPVVVAPGFRMVTVWAFAGETRRWRGWASDPSFAELLEKA